MTDPSTARQVYEAISARSHHRAEMRSAGYYYATQRYIAELKTELAARKVCGRHCPACVEFTTVFVMPKVEYLGCLRKQSESNRLMNKVAAPIGQPCPFTDIVEDGDE
jgi:protein required for attachment to host cells